MNVVVFAVERFQGQAVAVTDFEGDFFKFGSHAIGDDSTAVFRHQHDMHVQIKDDMSASAEVRDILASGQVLVSHSKYHRPMPESTIETPAQPVVNRARKRPKDAPTHVVSFALAPTPAQVKALESHFHAGTRFYNAVLAEMLTRLRAVKSDPAWDVTCAMPKGTKGSTASGARNRAFADVKIKHGFTKSEVGFLTTRLRRDWCGHVLSSHEAQVLAERVFAAVDDYCFGKRGRPRFKSVKAGVRGLGSLSGKDALSPIGPVRDSVNVVVGVKLGKNIRIVFRPVAAGSGRKNREQGDQLDSLRKAVDNGLLSTRIVRRTVRGKHIYVAQFVVDGRAPARHEPALPGTLGSLDLGPSKVALAHDVVDEATGELGWQVTTRNLAPSIDDILPELRRQQRHFDRQHRAGSPACFRADGTHKKSCVWGKPWMSGGVVRSSEAVKTQTRIQELHRRVEQTRVRDHGHLANQMYATAQHWVAEDLNYVAWQKNFPYSVRDKAPGAFISDLARKAESAGAAQFTEYSPWTTALSQTCLCGKRTKKPLSERTHTCGTCGITFQRDEFSAYLGLHVRARTETQPEDVLDLETANARWQHRADADSLLRADAPVCRDRDSNKSRGRRRPSRRSVARIRARRKRKSDSAQNLGNQPVTTTTGTHT